MGRLGLSMRTRLLVAVVALLVIAANFVLYRMVRQEFIPSGADEAQFEMNIVAPQGASPAAMNDVMAAIEKDVESVPGVRLVLSTVAGGPLGKVRDGDEIEIVIDRQSLGGTLNLVASGGRELDDAQARRLLAERDPHPDLAPDPALPDDTRLWAALQRASGGTWSGCVYDVERIVERLEGKPQRSQ